jgi:hypothetical protein
VAMNQGWVATARGVFQSAHPMLAQLVTQSMEISTTLKKIRRVQII